MMMHHHEVVATEATSTNVTPLKQCAVFWNGHETDGEGGQAREEASRATAGANHYPQLL